MACSNPFVIRSEGKIDSSRDGKVEQSRKIILEVMNRHFTMGQRIPSIYLRVFSDGTAECHTQKYSRSDKDVTKTKVLSAETLEKLQAVLNDPDLLQVKKRYELMRGVVDSWMEWDITVQHPGTEESIQIANFSPSSAREKKQPYPDALVKLGCSILKIRGDVYGDADSGYEADCPDTPSNH